MTADPLPYLKEADSSRAHMRANVLDTAVERSSTTTTSSPCPHAHRPGGSRRSQHRRDRTLIADDRALGCGDLGRHGNRLEDRTGGRGLMRNPQSDERLETEHRTPAAATTTISINGSGASQVSTAARLPQTPLASPDHEHLPCCSPARTSLCAVWSVPP